MDSNLVSRVEILEQKVTVLEQLPQRIDELTSQFLLFREEMRAEFVAVRVEAGARDEETRRVLREEIRAGDEETRTLMRVLHEEVIERFKRLDDLRRPAPRKNR